MEALIGLLALYLFVALVLFPIWVLVKISNQTGRLDRQRSRLEELQEEIRKLRATAFNPPSVPPPQEAAFNPNTMRWGLKEE